MKRRGRNLSARRRDIKKGGKYDYQNTPKKRFRILFVERLDVAGEIGDWQTLRKEKKAVSCEVT